MSTFKQFMIKGETVSKEAAPLLFKYQLGDSIGQGAFGKVFQALNLETGDFCAVKQIEKSIIAPHQLSGIMRECELLQTLKHPNIVSFLDSLETESHLFYVMEYIEGGSLHKVRKKYGSFPEGLLARYVADVLKGLQYLHSQGVIHRDIKGENVLITKQGVVKLVDFGSCTYQAMEKMLTVVGTPFWMAPEIIEMDGSARNTACDIWSLGCTMIELITGNPPYWERGPMPAMFAMVTDPHPPFPTGISEELNDFLVKCFTRDIQKRPTASALLEHPWITNHLKKEEQVPMADMLNFDRRDNVKCDDPRVMERMQQLEKENDNLNSTVRSLKMHLLKVMKEKKLLKDQIENLEHEVSLMKQTHHKPSEPKSPTNEHCNPNLEPNGIKIGKSKLSNAPQIGQQKMTGNSQLYSSSPELLNNTTNANSNTNSNSNSNSNTNTNNNSNNRSDHLSPRKVSPLPVINLSILSKEKDKGQPIQKSKGSSRVASPRDKKGHKKTG